MKYIPGILRMRSYHPINLAIIALLAAVGLTVFILLDLFVPYRYKMSKIGKEFGQGQVSGYYDINKDGLSEFIVLKSYGGRFPAVELYYDRNVYIDVIRPRGSWFDNTPSFCFGDFDQDSINEIYCFTVSNDSILLNAYEPLGDNQHFVINRFIDLVGRVEEKNDPIIAGTFFYDENGDGFEEFTFLLRAGFSLTPRRIYRFDILNQVLEKGENYAAGFTKLIADDINLDGKMEFIATANAIENYHEVDTPKKFNDKSGLLLGLNNELEVIFANEFPDNKTYVHSCILKENGKKVILALVYELTSNNISLKKYDANGKLLSEKQIFHDSYLRLLNDMDYDLDNIVITDMHDLHIYDYELNYLEKKEAFGIPITAVDPFEFKNISGYQLFRHDQEVVLSDGKLNILGRIQLADYSISNIISASVISMDSDHSFRFSVRTQIDGEYIIKAEKRILNHPALIIDILVYVLLYSLFFAIFRIQYYFFNRRLVSEQKIHELQLQAVQNQLQPHFTFNVLNTIGSLIYKNEKETAYEYLNHFSDMVRSTLISGMQTDWMIDEELHFIKTYLSMENLRFDNKFDFSLTILPGTDIAHKIPKLMVQTFVENAISHGLVHKKSDCRLSVKIEDNNSHIIIEVEDNGIGRFASGKLQRIHVGHGNEILKRYIEVYNKLNKTKFDFTIKDLFKEDGIPSGTRVTILIPRDYSVNKKLQ